MRRAVGLALLIGCVAACGTQLPDSRFRSRVVTTVIARAGQATGPTTSATAAESGALVAPSATAAAATQAGGEAVPVAVTTLPAVAPTTAAATAAASKGAKVSSAAATKPFASDIGVTATTITIGNIVSAGGIFGPEQFAKNQYGVKAFFDDLNTRGGIDGRKVIVNGYNDNGDGSQNVSIVQEAISKDKDFALVGNNIYNYAGAQMVNDAGMPDIASENIDGSYDKYSHLWQFGGDSYPRDNKQVGYPDGNSYGGSEIGKWFKDNLAIQKAGVVYYDQDDSFHGAQEFQREFQNAGISTTLYPVNLGLPNFSNAVAQMQSDGVQLVADALDANGNAKLCQAIDGNSAFASQMQVKLSSVSTWVSDIGSQFKQSPKCRSKIYVEDDTWNYTDNSNPGIAAFNAAMTKYFPSRQGLNAEWTLHGWLAGRWFTDAATPCGADLTRACLEKNMKAMTYYTAGGLTNKGSFTYLPESYYTTPGNMSMDCPSIAQWDDARQTWDTRNSITQCLTTPYIEYRPNG